MNTDAQIRQYAKSNGYLEVWRSWRDHMLAQGRDVPGKRMSVETLPQNDIELDIEIAFDVVRDFVSWLDCPVCQPDGIAIKTAIVHTVEYGKLHRRFLTRHGARIWLARQIALKECEDSDYFPSDEYIKAIYAVIVKDGKESAEAWAHEHIEEEDGRGYEKHPGNLFM